MPMIRLLVLILALGSTSFAAQGLPQSGAVLLLATPEVADPFFRHSVVLVTPHGRGAMVGLILNRPTRMQVGPDGEPADEEADGGRPLYFGGPVDPHRTVFLRRSSEPLPLSLNLVDDIYMSENPQLLQSSLAAGLPPGALRVFRGYAGWAPGQLEREIAARDWVVLPVESELLFADPDGLWERLIERHGGQWVEWRPYPSQRG